jgi:hypothetical protein
MLVGGGGVTAAPVRGALWSCLGTGGSWFAELGGADEGSNRRSVWRPAGQTPCGVTGAEAAGFHLALASRPGRATGRGVADETGFGSSIACLAWF